MMQTPSSTAAPDLVQAFYRHIAEDAHAPAFFVADPDDDFRLVHASASCAHVGTGVAQVGTHLWAWLAALEVAKVRDLWTGLTDIVETDIEVQCPVNGEAAPVGIRLSRWVHEGRFLLAGHVRQTEVRAGQAAAQARLEQEQHYSLMSANLPGFLYTCRVSKDGSLQFLQVSAGVEALVGLTPESIIASGNKVFDLVCLADRQMLHAAIMDSVEKLAPFHVEFRIQHEQRGERWLHARSTPVPQADGNVLYYGMMLDITERKQDEQRLRSKSIALAEAQRIAHLGSWTLDLTDNRLTWSDEVFRIFEIDSIRFKATYEAFVALVHPDDRERMTAAYETSLKLHQPYQVEHRLLMPDGRIKYVLERGEHRYGPNGEPLSTQGTVLDITERKHMEEALVAREREFRSLAESSPDVIVRFDRECRRIYANQTAARLAGKPAESMLGSTPADAKVLDSAYAEKLIASVRRVFVSGQREHIDLAVKFEDGSIHEYDSFVVPEFDADGRVATVLNLSRDITERKLADQQLIRLNASLDHVKDTVLLISEDARILYVNAGACDVLGHSREALLGMRISDIAPDYQLDGWPEHWLELKAHGSLNFETRHQSANGRIYPVDITANYVEFDGVGYNLAICRDITERKEAERALASQANFQSTLLNAMYEVGLQVMMIENGRIIHIGNRNMAIQKFGYTEEALDSHPPLLNIVHPDDRAMVMDYHRRRLAGEDVPTTYELGLMAHDGERLVYEVSAAVVPGTDPVRVITVGRDISNRKRIEDTLKFIAQQGWQAEEEPFLTGLARHLGRMLKMDYVIIDKLADDPAIAETVAIYAKGDVLPNMQYALHGTPCDDVMDGDLCCYSTNVRQRFPEDTLLVEMQVESYAGIPLWDSTGKVIGLIAVMDGKPMQDEASVTSLLKLVATRVAAELERERSAQALAESREFLHRIIDTIPDPVFVKDRAHRWIHLNQAFCDFIGHPTEALLGKSDYDFFPADEADVFWAKDEAVFESGAENVNEEKFTDRDGILHTIVTKKVCYADHQGQQFLVGIILDLTERKRMEELLAQRERDFRSLAENIPDNIARWDLEGRILYNNSTNQRTVGKSLDELIGKTFGEAFPDGRFARIDAAVLQVVADGLSTWIKHQLVPNETGGMDIHDIHFVPERDADGNIVSVLGVGRNMTDFYRMQEAIAEREQAFRSLAESSPNSIIRYDREGRIRYLNSALAHVLGATDTEVLGKLPSEAWPDGRYDAIQQAAAQVIEAEDEVLIEFQAPIPGGEEVFHQIRIVPERDVAGQVIGTIAFGWDISDLKRYTRSLQEKARLEEQLSGLAASVPGLIFTIRTAPDRQVSFPFVSAGVETLFGLQPEEVRKDASLLRARYHPEDLPRVLALMDESEQSLSPFRIEIRIFHPEHGMRWIEIRSTPQRYEDGSTEWHGIMLDITERKQHDEQLALQDHALNQVGEALYLMDDEARFVQVNAEACRALGYTRDALLTMRVFDIDPDFGPEQWRQYAAAGVSGMIETRHKASDGRIFPVEVNANQIEYQGNRYHLALVRDITGRKRMEEALAASEREFRSLAENSINIIVRYDRDCRRIYVNPAYERATGTQQSHAARGATPEQMWAVLNMSAQEYTVMLRRVMETGQREEIELQVPSADGQVSSHIYNVVPEYDADGACIGVLSIGHDITERKRAEQQLTLLNFALDHVKEGVFLYDDSIRFSYVNAYAAEYLGYSREELLGMGVLDIDANLLPEQLAVHWQDIKARGSVALESRHKTRDGNVLPVDVISNYFEFAGNGYSLALTRDISERKQYESRLALLDHAFNHVGEAVYLVDADARILQVNAEASRMLGYEREELLALRIYELDPDFGPEAWRLHWTDLLAKGSVTVETHHRTKTGDLIPIEVNANFIVHEGQHYNFALVRDITERQRIQEAIQSSQSALENAQRIAHIGSWDVDMVNDVLTWSDEVFRIWEIDKTQFAATLAAFLETVHPEDREKVVQAYNQSIIDKSLYEVEHRLLFPDGRVKYIHERGEPYYDEEGRPVRFVGTALDITERKRAEEALLELNLHLEENARSLEEQATELEASQEQLKLTEAWYRGIVRSAPDGMVVVDARGHIALVNEHLEKMFGYDEGELMGRPMEILLPPNMREQHVGKRNGFFGSGARGRPMAGVLDSLYACRKDGSVFPVDVSLSRLPDADGNAGIVCAAIRDVTERKRMADVLAAREREFRTLVENLPTYVVRLDRNLCHVYANPAYMSAVGIFEDRLYGLHVSAFWRAENVSIEDYVALLKRVLKSGMQEKVTLEWRSNGGRFYSHMVRVAPELDAHSKISGLLVLGFDITAQRREQLLDAERQHVFEAMAHGGNLSTVLGQVAGYIEASGRGMRASIMVLDESGGTLRCVAAPSLPAMTALGTIDILKDNGCCAMAVLNGQRTCADHVCIRDEVPCTVFAQHRELQGCWSEPILAASGETLGVVTVYLQQPGEPQGADLELLREASNLCAIAIERKRIEEQMQRHASYDSLTSLPNRRMFGLRLRDEILRAGRNGEGVGLLFIDLDHFKEVNDSLGHEVGDRLLLEAARRLRSCVRESDTVARLGGDEFVIILTQVAEVAFMGHLAQSIIDLLAQPFYLDEHTAYVTASIGIAAYPTDAQDAEDLIRCADQAMYVAKDDGRNNFSFFTSAIQQQVQSRLELAKDLREAIEKRQLQVHYQPIVDIATGEVVKAEALLRWQHPSRGMIPPDLFIPVAEENGLIHEIGDWVFRQAVSIAKRWNESQRGQRSGSVPSLRQVSVNLSPRQFSKGRIDKDWLDHLQSLGADPRCIAIEITEGLLLDDRMDIMEKLARFGMAGMQVALDDFGTGYSAMAYLKKFPIDYLKIDRSFVRDIETDTNDRAIAEAIVVMANKLGLKVIAEGVETEGQRAILNAVGCEYVQGYLYAKPMREEDFLTFAGVQ